jgi:hypothetical protein
MLQKPAHAKNAATIPLERHNPICKLPSDPRQKVSAAITGGKIA